MKSIKLEVKREVFKTIIFNTINAIKSKAWIQAWAYLEENKKYAITQKFLDVLKDSFSEDAM